MKINWRHDCKQKLNERYEAVTRDECAEVQEQECRVVVEPNCEDITSSECRDETVTKLENQCVTTQEQQVRLGHCVMWEFYYFWLCSAST